jgi:hypothetical protein
MASKPPNLGGGNCSKSNQLRDRPLPRFIQDKLASPPEAGTGIHSWVFECVRVLIPWRPPPEIFQILKEAALKCSRPVPDREILDCIKNARNDWEPQGGLRRIITLMEATVLPPKQKPRAEPDWDAVAAIAKSGRSVADLIAASPVPVALSAEEVITQLWYGDPLLCIAKSHPADAVTRRRSEWLAAPGSIAQNGLIVPSPMSARTGQRQDGRSAHRSLDNTGPRWFLVVEFDFKAETRGTATPAAAILKRMAAESPPRTAPDLCAAILIHLMGQGAPMVMAVHSGGKSVHGWFPTHGATDDTLKPFFTNACRLGADPATWTLCQLVRLPGGTRADGTHQQILYFNRALINAA